MSVGCSARIVELDIKFLDRIASVVDCSAGDEVDVENRGLTGSPPTNESSCIVVGLRLDALAVSEDCCSSVAEDENRDRLASASGSAEGGMGVMLEEEYLNRKLSVGCCSIGVDDESRGRVISCVRSSTVVGGGREGERRGRTISVDRCSSVGWGDSLAESVEEGLGVDEGVGLVGDVFSLAGAGNISLRIE